MDQGDPLEDYRNIRRDLEEEILQGKSPKPDRRHAQIRLGPIEKYKHVPLERMIKQNAKDPAWGTQLISALESLYGLGGELLQSSAKGEEQQNAVISIDKELQEISGTTDILRSLGYHCIDDKSAIAPTRAQVNREDTSAVLAEILLAKDEMMTFLSGKHVLHDDICQLIPDDFCPAKRKVSTKENTQKGKDETALSEATKEDKTNIPETVSSSPTCLTAEESRCPQCDFINLADASLCISCAEPLTDTSQSTSHAKPLRKTSLSHTEPLTETSHSQLKEMSLPKEEPFTDTSLSHAKQLTDTSYNIARAESLIDNSLSHAEPLNDTSQKRTAPLTETSLKVAEPLPDTSLQRAEMLTDTSPKRTEPLPDASRSHTKLLTDTRDSHTKPLTNTRLSLAEPQTDTSGLKDTETEGQTAHVISCPYCTFDNPKTNKICCMCSKTMILSPIQSHGDEDPGLTKPQYLQIVKLPDSSATFLVENKAKFLQVINIPDDSSASQIGHKQDHGEEDSTGKLNREEKENPGCPHCTFQNPLPTNFCTMCGERLPRAVNGTGYSPQTLTHTTGYNTKHGLQPTADGTGGQDASIQTDQSLYKNKTEYSDKQCSSSQQLMPNDESKECIRCITCKGELRDDNVHRERRKCSLCPCSYCRECSQPFVENCRSLTCLWTSHCHHKRSCTYWLRQRPDRTLEWYLNQSKCPFLSFLDWFKCRNTYGREGRWSNYTSYLIKVIQEHRIDPADGMTRLELSDLIQIMLNVDVDWNANRETLVEFVKKNIPL